MAEEIDMNLECVLVELECMVDDFCFYSRDKKMSEIDMLRLVARHVPMSHIGGYHGRHYKKNQADKVPM